MLSGIATPTARRGFRHRAEIERLHRPLQGRREPRRRATGSPVQSTQHLDEQPARSARRWRARIALPSAAGTRRNRRRARSCRETAILSADDVPRDRPATTCAARTGTNLEQTQRSEPLLLLLRSGFLQTGAPFGGADGSRERSACSSAQSLSSLRHRRHRRPSVQGRLGLQPHRADRLQPGEQRRRVLAGVPVGGPKRRVHAPTSTCTASSNPRRASSTLSASPDGNLNLDIKTNDVSLFAQDTWQVHPGRHDQRGRPLRLLQPVRRLQEGAGAARRRGVGRERQQHHDDRQGELRAVLRSQPVSRPRRRCRRRAASSPKRSSTSRCRVSAPTTPNSLIDYVITSGFPTRHWRLRAAGESALQTVRHRSPERSAGALQAARHRASPIRRRRRS